MNDKTLSEMDLGDVVKLEPFIASEVKLRRDLWRVDQEMNSERLEYYVPTEASRKALKRMLEGASANMGNQIHLLTGSYGTGKSYLLLVLANLLGRDLDREEIETLIGRIEKKEERYQDNLSAAIDRARKSGKYLVVVPDYAEKNFKSALLDALRDALDQENIDYRPDTEYDQAADLITRWMENRNPILEDIKQKALNDGTTLKRIKASIKEDYEKEALNKLESYYESLMDVTLSYDNVKVEETYKDVEKYIREEEVMRGVIILFDEFGHFLNKFVNRPESADGQIIQDFIESIKKYPSGRILLILAAHRSVADYAKGNVSQKDIEKVAGRFEERHRLTVASNFDEAEEMLYNTIIRTGDSTVQSEIESDIEDKHQNDWSEYIAKWYPDRDESWRREVISKGCYPLHPATVKVLPKLSDRVGQSTRTMFKYVSPSESEGLSAFINRNQVYDDRGELQLLTIDDLYSYFLGAADVPESSKLDAAQIKRRYQRALGSIQVEDPLGDRILKALAIMRVVTDENLQPTADTLVWVLHLHSDREERAYELLEVLSDQGAIRRNRTTGIYKFRGAGAVSVDAIHKEHLKENSGLSPSEEVDIYKSVYDITKDKIDPWRYNDKLHTNRKVVQDYLLEGNSDDVINGWVENLKDVYDDGKGNSYEGNIVMLRALCRNEREKKNIKNKVNQINEKFRKYFVVGLSTVGNSLVEAALNVDAAIKTSKDEKVHKNEDAKDEANHLLVEYEEAMEEKLRNETSSKNFEWFYDDSVKYKEGDLSEEELITFIDKIFERLFNKTPKISNNLVQHYTVNRDSHRKKRREVMNTLIERDEFSLEGTSKKQNMLRGFLRPTGMCEKTENRTGHKTYLRLRPPHSSNAKNVWSVLENNLCLEGQESRLLTATENLYHGPYGLSHPAVDMFLAAFVGYHSDEFILRKGTRKVPLTGQNLSKARANTSEFSLRYQPLTPTQKRYLSGILEMFGDDDEFTSDPWVEASSAVLEWYEGLSVLTKNFAPKEDPNVKSLLQVLSKLEDADQSEDKVDEKDILSRKLPEKFGYDAAKIENNDSLKNELIEDISHAKKESDNFKQVFSDDILKEISYKAFDDKYDSRRQFKKKVDEWIESIPITAKQHFKKEGGKAGTLLRKAGRQGDIATLFLEEIPDSWDDFVPFTSWTAQSQREDYVEKVTEVVLSIQTYQASPLPLLKRISEEAFGVEIESEEEFESLVLEWYDDLEPEKRNRLIDGEFSSEATALRNAIEKTGYSDGSVSDHFLEYLPEQLNVPGGGWPNIPDHGRTDLVLSISEVVDEVDSWQPPLTTDAMAERILRGLSGRIWDVEDYGNPAEKLEEKAEMWYETLPPAIDSAEFDGVESLILETIKNERRSLKESLETDVPDLIEVVKPSKAKSAEEGKKIVNEVQQAFQTLDNWDRPVPHLIDSLGEWSDLFAENDDAGGVTIDLLRWWDNLKKKPPKNSFEEDSVSYHLIKWARNKLEWEEVFPELANAADVPQEYLYWSTEDEKKFAKSINRAKNNIESWDPPKPSREKIRKKVKESFEEITNQMNIEMGELKKIVLRILNEGE